MRVVYLAGFYSHGAGWLGAASLDELRPAEFDSLDDAYAFVDCVLVRERGHPATRVGVRVAVRLADGFLLEA